MRLSELEMALKNALPKWKIEIDNEIIKFSIISWSEETKICYKDLKAIRDMFCNESFELISKIREWERNNFAIDHIIQIKHSIKFEKEEWEEYL